MLFHDLVGDLALKLESEEPTPPNKAKLVDRIRASYDPQYGAFDHNLATQLLDRILDLLASYDHKAKREAYNEFAESEGLSQLDERDEDFDYWIHESLLDPVVGIIVDDA